MWWTTTARQATRRRPTSTHEERAVPARGRAPRKRRANILRGRILRRAGFACPANIKSRVPEGPRPFGAWNGWYVVDYNGQTGYAAAAYIDT